MSAPAKVRKRVVVGLAAAALLSAGVALAWVERTPALAWVGARWLARASEQDRAVWADRVAWLGEDAEPAVLAWLTQSDDAACRNAGEALKRWAGQWGSDDPRAAVLAGRMAKGFPNFSTAGRMTVLTTAGGWFTPTAAAPSDALLGACVGLVTASAEAGESDVHVAALDFCSAALDQGGDSTEMLTAGRQLLKAAFHDESAVVRLRALQLAVHPNMEVMDEVAPLLHDAAPDVRRAALLALGPAGEDVTPVNSLLPLLHDADPEVRAACAEVLRKDRKLSPQRLKIGWCLYHPDPAQRLNVLDYLQRGTDVEPGAWLRELSHDAAPSVRLAAVRVMSQQDKLDLADRLEQMADGDPSPTVCQMARLYQKWAKAAAATDR